MQKKAILSVGGTAGHLIPAQETAESLLNNGWDVVFFGKGLKSNPFFNRDKFEFLEIASATFCLKNPFDFLRSSGSLIRGCLSAWHRMRQLSPSVVVGFGSYHSFPALIAGKLLRIPLVLHEQNIVPGKVNRLMGRFAKGIGIMFPESCFNTTAPVQTVFTKDMIDTKKYESYKTYDHLSMDGLTVLVFGGSQGSEVINHFIFGVLPDLKQKYEDLQVIHLIGDSKSLLKEACNVYEKASIPHVVRSFEQDMARIMRFSDVAICRSGAGTIKQLIENELPAVLIPYPGAGGHQQKNAEFFTNIVQGGIIIKQDELNPEDFVERLSSLIGNDMFSLRRDCLHTYRKNWDAGSFVAFIEHVLSQKKLTDN